MKSEEVLARRESIVCAMRKYHKDLLKYRKLKKELEELPELCDHSEAVIISYCVDSVSGRFDECYCKTCGKVFLIKYQKEHKYPILNEKEYYEHKKWEDEHMQKAKEEADGIMPGDMLD